MITPPNFESSSVQKFVKEIGYFIPQKNAPFFAFSKAINEPPICILWSRHWLPQMMPFFIFHLSFILYHLSLRVLLEGAKPAHLWSLTSKTSRVPSSHVPLRSFNMCRGQKIIVYYYYNYILYYIMLYNINIPLSLFPPSLENVEGA